MSFQLSNLQRKTIKRILDEKKRINTLWGSVRSSKTWCSLVAWILFVGKYKGKGELLCCGNTERTIERNVYNPLRILLGNNCNYIKNRGELYIFDKKIYCIGASDERSQDKIKGVTAGGAYVDEITTIPESFFTMLLSRLSEDDAQLIGTTNTDSPYHYLKANYLDRKDTLDLLDFKFLLDDNPFISKKYKVEIKKEYIGLWYKRFILAEWCVAEGSIYDFFDDKYVKDKCPFEPDQKFIGIDYATGNPTAFLLIYSKLINGKRYYHIEREYYWDSKKKQRQKTDSDYSSDLKDFINGEKIDGIYLDPSAASFALQLKRDGFYQLKDAINDVIDGIRTVATLYVTGRLTIGEKCENYLKETYSYFWDPTAQKQGIDKPKKVNDHTQDAGRYVFHTLETKKILLTEDSTRW
jgi:PBSX family phage terminase large subunit